VTDPEPRIAGTCHPDFAAVGAAFRRNFSELGEVGASVCVTVGGERVVDLWGGTTSLADDADPWVGDTLVCVHSCTKGMVALCAHLLADRGLIDLDAPVGDIWPEWASGAGGAKARTTVRMMLSHQAGVPAVREKLPDGACHDWDLMCATLAAEAPFWEPGTRNGYHMLTFGWVAGELVRRVDGRSIGRFLAEEIAGPTRADVWLGLPEAEEMRVAKVIPNVPDPRRVSAFTEAILRDRTGVQALALLNNGGFSANSRASHAAEIGGGGGLATARGLASMYVPTALGGGDLFSPEAVVRMGRTEVATEHDAVLCLPTRFSLGFMVSMDNRRRRFANSDSAIIGDGAFGHVGAGGSIGFCDPAKQMSFGYVMNRMGPGILLNERGQSLVDAAYAALRC
jgi:CubicO group peptidase (beta-lactamase class C family)